MTLSCQSVTYYTSALTKDRQTIIIQINHDEAILKQLTQLKQVLRENIHRLFISRHFFQEPKEIKKRNY